MRRWLAFLVWAHGNPGAALQLLGRARELREVELSMSAAFRAGLRVGLEHPEIGRAIVAEVGQ